MDNQAKEYMVHALRKEFIAFMQGVAKIPGSHVQKQQAFLRFDEGHMWMQNAILSYVAPQPEPQPPADGQNQVSLSPEEIAALAQKTANEMHAELIADGQAEVSPAA